jgi:hypothetical protein
MRNYVAELWHWQQRRLDLIFLWPAVKKEAGERGQTIDFARAAFYYHAMRDKAWTSLGIDEMSKRIDELS